MSPARSDTGRGKIPAMSSEGIGIPGLEAPSDPSLPSTPGKPRSIEGIVLTVWALLTIAAVLIVIGRAEHDALHDPVEKAARGEISGLGPLSLLRADRLQGALQAIQNKLPDGRYVLVRVEPTRINAQLHTGDYKLKIYNVDAALHLHEDATSETSDKGIPADTIDPAAPQRLITAVNRRTGTKPQDVDYVVLATNTDHPRQSRWQLFLLRGAPPDQRGFSSDIHGRHVKAGA